MSKPRVKPRAPRIAPELWANYDAASRKLLPATKPVKHVKKDQPSPKDE